MSSIVTHRMTENKLLAQESYDIYVAVAEGVDTGLVVIRDNIFFFVNRRACEIFGYKKEELLAMKVPDVVYPDDRQLALERISKRISGKTVYPYRTEMRIVHGSGEIRWIETRSTRIRWQEGWAILVFINDIHERKLDRVQVLEQKAFLESILDDSDLFVAVIDVGENGEFTFNFFSRAFERMTGLHADDFIGLTPERLIGIIPPESSADINGLFTRCVATGKTVPFEDYIPIMGKTSWWYGTLTPVIDETGRVYRIIGSIIDFTIRKNLENELEEYRQHLESLVKERTLQLEEQLRRVREAEHEVRSLSERLIEVQEKERREIGGLLHDEVGGTLTMLRLASDRVAKKLGGKGTGLLGEINQMINDAADQVRYISHTMRPAMLDDYGLLEALDWFIEGYETKTGVKVTFTHTGLGAKMPAKTETAAYRIIQEAMTNAARHSRAEHLDLHVACHEGNLTATIHDRGQGFDPRIASHGFGLSQMQDLANLTGGTLTVESALESGTKVSFSLPVNQECAP